MNKAFVAARALLSAGGFSVYGFAGNFPIVVKKVDKIFPVCYYISYNRIKFGRGCENSVDGTEHNLKFFRRPQGFVWLLQ